tara:strand:+ start:211 stop:432 length:222 start_codon:yes stop_codon:yes gene_type:complete
MKREIEKLITMYETRLEEMKPTLKEYDEEYDNLDWCENDQEIIEMVIGDWWRLDSKRCHISSFIKELKLITSE